MLRYIIYSDGACSGNPGPGGWGVIIRKGDEVEELSGGVDLTTNNRMEMLAVIKGLQKIPQGSQVSVFTDSQYVQKGMQEWLIGWKKKQWKTASGGVVKNKDLWQDLDQLCQGRHVEWVWVRGHNGDAGNERADELARKAIGG